MQWCWFGVALLYNYGDSFQSFLRSTHTKLDFPWLRMYLQYHTWVSFSLYATLFVFSVLSLKKGYYKYQMGQLTWTIVTLCLIVFQMRSILDNIFKGLVWLFFPASLVVCNDCFAYFCGKLFGKRFIKAAFLKLSPNKTWEGFLGAFVCTVAFGFWSSALLAQSTWMTCPLESIEVRPMLSVVGTTPVAAVVSIPRVQLYPIQVRDFDSVIPGHGGFMDRMDCQFITALFTTVYCTTFIWSYSTTADAIVQQVVQLPRDQQLQVLHQLQAVLATAL
ncbi:hypothetical protein DYB32_007588 [Aphanomyces invadans]|uniref:phosphatidate cytidylyltransferase n=1 Tax=Aphanomyces invadans TaxID=157072 RepID=A0A3R7A5D1_9STRA|nr:hypothetical protein DYB32_007588 [Aphanomyces invadans]